jgi:hypothetical protein
MVSALARQTIPFATLTISLLTLSACSAHRVAPGAAPQSAPTSNEAAAVQRVAYDPAIAASPTPRTATDESTWRMSFDPVWFTGGATVDSPLQLTTHDWFVPAAFAVVERVAPSPPLDGAPWALDNVAQVAATPAMHLAPATVFLAVADRLPAAELDLPVSWSSACVSCDITPSRDEHLAAALFTSKPAIDTWRSGGDNPTPVFDAGVKNHNGIDNPVTGIDSPVTATPEPATLTLAAIGIASLAGFRRRGNRRS